MWCVAKVTGGDGGVEMVIVFIERSGGVGGGHGGS